MTTHPSLRRRTMLKLLGSAALASAATGALPTALKAQSEGGTLTYVLGGEPSTLVAINSTSGMNLHVSAKMTEGLLAYGLDMTPQPQLATEWSVSEDGKTIAFTIREGVKFHDGSELTAEDVAFSLMMLKEIHPRQRGALTELEEVVVVDPTHVELKLARPAPYILNALAAAEAPMVSKAVYEGSDPGANPANAAPVGTGPYKFVEWVKGSHIIVEKNPDYWDEGLPRVDRIIFRVIRDAAAQAVAMETGEGDIIDGVGLSVTDLERLEELDFIDSTTEGWAYSPTVCVAEFNFDNEILANPGVRKAIAHAVDLEALVAVAWYGRAHQVTGPIPPTFERFYPELEPYAYDTDLAEQMLDEAGYPRGDDGTRFSLTIDPVPYGTGPTRSAIFLQQALEDIGIAAELREQDFASYVTRLYTDRDFDICVNSISTGSDPILGLPRLYETSQFKVGVPFSNVAHYSSEAVDAALEEARITVDPEARAEALKSFATLVYEDLPNLTLASQIKATVFNTRVHDHTVGADGMRSTLKEVWLDG